MKLAPQHPELTSALDDKDSTPAPAPAATRANAADRAPPWAIVLAAGRGQRLARLTRALYGRDVPKQFAALGGEQTFLQQTMSRAARLTPSARTIVVASEEYADLARLQLAAFEGVRVVEQPRDVGTLPGLLLPLAHVLAEAPHARVIVYPADHHVHRVAPFVDAVRAAVDAVDAAPARAVLVGARADRPSTDLGWIQRGPMLAQNDAGGGVSAVERFVEKPPAAAAKRLFASGALWNTLLLALDGGAFWDAAFAGRAVLAAAFGRYRAAVGTADEAAVRREIYAQLATLDLSRDLLQSQPGLGVVEMGDAGWSDCGTPERLFECLEVSGGLTGLLGRLALATGGASDEPASATVAD
jgi:mannose-1-phosphate guanylyltransferase